MLKRHSTGLIATVSDPVKFRELERSLTVEKIVETALPMSVVMQNVSPGDLERSLDIQLTKLVENLNLKWNLTPPQIKTIVEDLIDKYKSESLEDFILVFKKARQGEFGELYRLDSAVIFGWMEFYLSEKYEALERKLMREKDNIYKPMEPQAPDELRDKYIDQMVQELKPTVDRSVLTKTISDEEIKAEGKARPKALDYTPPTAEYMDLRNKTRALAAKRYRGKTSFNDLNNYIVEGVKIFCESQAVAEEIYIEAITTEE